MNQIPIYKRTTSTKRIFYCYAHIDTINNEVFYIGKGYYRNDVNIQRFECKKDRNKWHLNKWKKVEDAQTLLIEIFFESENEEECLMMEKDAILFYGRKDIKTGILLNLTNGGDGVSGLKCSYKGQKRNPLIGQAISKAKKGNCSGFKHPQINTSVYKFVHKSGLIEECTMYEFYTKYNLLCTSISRLVLGKAVSVKGWYLNEIKHRTAINKKSYVSDKQLKTEYDNGLSLPKLSKKYNITSSAIRKRIINIGGKIRTKRNNINKLNLEDN